MAEYHNNEVRQVLNQIYLGELLLNATFDGAIEKLQKEKEYYEEYIRMPQTIHDRYNDGTPVKKVQFSEIELRPTMSAEFPHYLEVVGVRDMLQEEISVIKKREYKSKQQRKQEYLKLKKEFGEK